MAKDDLKQLARDVINALDIRAEYAALGVRVSSSQPSPEGWLSCHAIGRDDSNASAGINVGTGSERGNYNDFGDPNGKGSMSIFDAAALSGKFTDWKEARKHYADKVGISLSTKSKKQPDDDLEFRDWNESLVGLWIRHKRGANAAAFQRAGGKIAIWRKHNHVAAMPVFGPNLLDSPPVGWVIWNRNGKELPLFSPGKQIPEWKKMLSTAGSKAGWMGKSAIESIDQAEVAWKVEGPTDMMALDSLIPDDLRGKHVVLTNSGGSTENPKVESLAMFAGKTVYVLHDPNKAGEAGADKWSRAIAGIADVTRRVRLPFEIVEKGGIDLRKWIVDESKTYQQILELAESSAIVEPPGALQSQAQSQFEHGNTNNNSDSNDTGSLVHEREIMRVLQLDVLGELEGGQVQLFSLFHRKTVTISDISRLTYTNLLRIAGTPVKQFVVETASDNPVPGTYGFRDVRDAIALLSGFGRITDQSILGAGVWFGDEYGDSTKESVIAAGAGEVAIWSGSGKLERQTVPRVANRIFDISNSNPWFSFNQLSEDVEACTHEVAAETIQKTVELFERWRWQHQDSSPDVITGLILASRIQSLWNWRPQVSVTGKSNSGKSILFDCLRGIFGNLVSKSSDQTAAGIRAEIQTSSKIILCDEFEDSPHRQAIIEMARSCGRGDIVLRGTPSQKGHRFLLRQIFWVGGVELGLKRAADRNRFIRLELLDAAKGKENQLTVPGATELRQLGSKLLAIAIRYSREAVALASDLKRTPVKDVHSRIIESYAVPCAIMATACGMNRQETESLLMKMTAPLQKEEKFESDEIDLLHTIFAAIVDLGHGNKATVASLVGTSGENLDRVGIKVVDGRRRNSEQKHDLEIEGREYLFVAQKSVKAYLLKGTPWEFLSIEQILRRIPGAFSDRRYVGGQKPSGTCIPMDFLKREFLDDSENPNYAQASLSTDSYLP